MIIEAAAATIVSNIEGGETFDMVISAEGAAHVMDTLTNLYQDPKMAVIRETIANALDSHAKAGQTEPVIVSLPTRDNCQFVVQDFGVGMNRDDIKDVFREYGTSTKRTSNLEAGAFGLGAKSPLAIANQFTLTIVKDGEKANVLVRKSPDGINKITVLGRQPTEEVNGVTVSVPVELKDLGTFRTTAAKFLKFAVPGSLLVDYAKTESVFNRPEIEKLVDPENADFEGYVNTEYNFGESFIVMGSLPYLLSNDLFMESAERQGLDASTRTSQLPKYFPVPLGTIDLTGNREGVRATKKTLAVIDELVASFLRSMSATAQIKIDAVENRADVREVTKKWEEVLGLKFQWKGEDVPSTISTGENPVSVIRRGPAPRFAYGKVKSDHSVKYDLNPWKTDEKTIIVTGQPYDKYKSISGYLTDFMKLTGITNKTSFVFVETLDALDTPWITENDSFTFETFEGIKDLVKDHRKAEKAAERALQPRKERVYGPVTYPVLDIENGVLLDLPYKEISSGATYLSQNDLWDNNGFPELFNGSKSHAEKLIANLSPHVNVKFIVLINQRRKLETLTKRISGLRNFREEIVKISEKVSAKATPEVLRYRAINEGWASGVLYEIQTPEDLLDPELRERVVFPDAVKRTVKELESTLKITGGIPFRDKTDIVASLDTDHDFHRDSSYFKKYPLIRNMHGNKLNKVESDHVVLYLNSAYSTLVDTKKS